MTPESEVGFELFAEDYYRFYFRNRWKTSSMD